MERRLQVLTTTTAEELIELQESATKAIVVLREALVLMIVLRHPHTEVSDTDFEERLNACFGRLLGRDMKRFHLAAAAIRHLGRDRMLFYRIRLKVYGSEATDEELDQLWPAYETVANMGQGFTHAVRRGPFPRP